MKRSTLTKEEHIESLVGAVVAHRMKGKRRHWSSLGMQNMGKVLQVVRNQELSLCCGRHPYKQTACPTSARSPRRALHRLRSDPGAWLP